MEYVYILLLLGVVLALCIFVNRVTDRLKVPSLLLFIGLGMVFGLIFRAVGIGNFTDYGLGNVVCSICLVFVIFYGGFGTNFKAARPIVPQALLLSFAGTAMTAGLIGCCVYLIFHAVPFLGGIGWTESMLIGSVISSTTRRPCSTSCVPAGSTSNTTLRRCSKWSPARTTPCRTC